MDEVNTGLHWLILSIVLCIGLGPSDLTAQEFGSSGDSIIARSVPTFGIRVGPPAKFSIYGGVRFRRQTESGASDDIWLTAEPGLSGGTISVGRAWVSGGHVVPGMLLAVTGSVLRTWGDPWIVAPDQTFIGVKGRLGFLFVSIGIGGYVRVQGSAGGDAVFATADVSIGT